MIPGSVPVLTRTADDRSNSGSLITAPAHALYLTTGDIYAPSVIGSGGALYLQLGQDCTVTGSGPHSGCPDKIKVTVNNGSANTINTISFNITIDNRFIDGQATMMVSFIQIVERFGEPTRYNISGYLHFNSQPNAECDSYTQPITTQCDCPTTGTSDPTRATNSDTTCLGANSILPSGSMQNHLDLLGSVLIVVVSLLFFAT